LKPRHPYHESRVTRVPERDPEYVKQLEGTLKKFLEPVHGVPLGVVVRALTGHSTIAWKDEDAHCRALKPPLCEGIAEATRSIGREGLDASRPNEVGNYIETPVASALTAKGFVAQVPASASGVLLTELPLSGPSVGR
jgi:hypothetical protein